MGDHGWSCEQAARVWSSCRNPPWKERLQNKWMRSPHTWPVNTVQELLSTVMSFKLVLVRGSPPSWVPMGTAAPIGVVGCFSFGGWTFCRTFPSTPSAQPFDATGLKFYNSFTWYLRCVSQNGTAFANFELVVVFFVMVLLLISEGVSPNFAQQKNILLLYPSISYFSMKLASFWLTDLLKER